MQRLACCRANDTTQPRSGDYCLKQKFVLSNLHLLDLVQSLKRKRLDGEEELDTELAKRLKKSEKKRRKRERRAARVSQLGNKISSLHYPSTSFNVDIEPGPSHRSHDSLSRGPVLKNIPLATTIPRPRWSTPESLLSMSSRESHSQQDQNETRPGEVVSGLNGHRLPSSSPNSQRPLSTSFPSASIHDSPLSSINEDASDNLSNQGALSLLLL